MIIILCCYVQSVTGQVKSCDGESTFLIKDDPDNNSNNRPVWFKVREGPHFRDLVLQDFWPGRDRSAKERAAQDILLSHGRRDTESVVDISIKVYYTSGYKRYSGNIKGDVRL